jgi:homoserine O-acetyltransferase/O-succinyltransferase
MTHLTLQEKPFILESGDFLAECTLAYETWGTLNKDRSNVVLVTHALTGSADAADWWSG